MELEFGINQDWGRVSSLATMSIEWFCTKTERFIEKNLLNIYVEVIDVCKIFLMINQKWDINKINLSRKTYCI